jgi:hypothetical protein
MFAYILVASYSSNRELANKTIAGTLANMPDRRIEYNIGNNTDKAVITLANIYVCQTTKYFKTQRQSEDNKRDIFINYQLCTIPSIEKEFEFIPNNI